MKASGGIVFEGVIDGNNGDNGYNTAQVALYRRSATALTNNDRPTGTLTYTFSTGRVSGASSYYNGWSQSIPETVAGTKLYVIMAIARSQSDTDDIAASDWSTPVEYVADGVNSAPVFIYKRSKTQPTDKPADGATYYFKKAGSTEAGTLSGTLNGWSTQIPATDNNHYPCWVRQAMAVSNGNTDVINASEWSDPATKLIEDGVSITSADVVFVLSDSGSTAPADSVTWKTSFAELDIKNTNASKFVWQAVKVVLSNGTTSYTGKQCLGKVSEFASITEQYALGTASAATGTWQDNTPPSAEKGKYLWTRTKLTYSDNSVGYSPSEAGQCVGYFGTDGKGISSADIMFCLGNSQTTAPGDSSFTATSFAELNIKSTDADKYVWQCIKTTYTSGNPTYSGKVCLGKVSDFASITEQYALGTASAATGTWQDNTPPSAEKGKYLWTRTKLTYSGGGTTYVPSSSGQCIGYFGTDGSNAQYIFLKGSAFNKDSAGTNIVNSEIRVNGGNNLATQSRGLCLVTLNRQTLAVVDSATIYDTYEGTTGKNNLITKLNSLGDNVFVCLVSFDAIGWSDTLISLLQTFGMSDLPYTSANRYPFLFIGYKNLGKGNGITRMNDMAEPAIPVELGVYVANGALSVKDGKNGEDAITYKISLAGSVFANDPNYSGGKMHVNIKGKVYKVEGGNTTVFTSLTSSMLDLYYIEKDGDVYNFNTGEFSVGTGSNAGTFSTTLFNNQGWSEEEIFLAVLRVGGVEVARESIQIEIYGMNGQSIKGDTGKMCYIAGEYDPAFIYRSNDTQTVAVEVPVAGSTETKLYVLKTSTNVDGDGVHHGPSDTDYWEEGLNRYNLLRTKYLFADFAKLGSGVVSGDWLFSAKGTINGTVYNDSNTHGGVAAYMAFNGNDPLGNGIIKVNDVTKTLAYNVADSGYFGSMTLTQGRDLVIKAKGYRNDYSTNKVYLKLYQLKVNATTGVWEYIFAASLVWDSVTETEKALTFTVMESGTYYLRVEHTTSSSSENGSSKVSNIVATEFGFAPNFAVDLLTGRSYQKDCFINGFIRKKKTIITTSNISQYKRDDIAGATVLDFDKCGSFIELSTGTYGYLTLPLMSAYLASRYTSKQIDDIRSFVGTTLLIYNKSGQNIPMTLRYNSDGSTTSGTLHNGNCVELECCLKADDNDGKEIIYWKVIDYAEPVN